MIDLYIPESVVFELTYQCNHRCLFCSCPWYATADGAPHYAKGQELDFDQWRQVIDKLHTLGVKNISISGGEALMKDCLIDILEYIRKTGKYNIDGKIVVISNGLLMSHDYLRAFAEYGVHLSMSLPGLQTFEKHTGVDNAEGVLYWFGEAKKMGLETTVNVTVTDLNYHELFETLANGLIAGADTVLVNRFLAGGRGLSHVKELTINREQMNGMLDTAERVLQLSKRIGSVGTELPRCVVEDPEKYERLRIGYMCAAAKGFFVIDPAGYVRACNHSPRKVGHALDEQIITDKKYWRSFTDRNYIPSGCIMCKDTNYCDCGCRETASIFFGNTKALDPCLTENGKDICQLLQAQNYRGMTNS